MSGSPQRQPVASESSICPDWCVHKDAGLGYHRHSRMTDEERREAHHSSCPGWWGAANGCPGEPCAGLEPSCDEGSAPHLTSDHFPRPGLAHNPWSAACIKHGMGEPSCSWARCITCQHVEPGRRTTADDLCPATLDRWFCTKPGGHDGDHASALDTDYPVFWRDQAGREAARSTTRKSSLTTLDWYRLNRACEPVWDAFGGTYLVGTAASGGEYRDVDVRTILADDDFDRLCSDRNVWTLLCTSIGTLLREATNMPIDYQIQRRTEANEKYPGGNRHPVGMVVEFAGGGDATAFAAVTS